MIYVGADHRGFAQKGRVVEWLEKEGYALEDMGAMALDKKDDYNDCAVRVARKVVAEEGARGVLVCGSGEGVCMQANRFRGVRAILGLTPELARVSRIEDDANVLCLAADFVPDPSDILRAFLTTEFSTEERYARRRGKLDDDWAEG